MSLIECMAMGSQLIDQGYARKTLADPRVRNFIFVEKMACRVHRHLKKLDFLNCWEIFITNLNLVILRSMVALSELISKFLILPYNLYMERKICG